MFFYGSLCVYWLKVRRRLCMSLYRLLECPKLKFHATDTDTDTDFLAAEVGARRGSRPAAAPAARSARRLVRGLLSDTRAFPREGVRWGCARVHVYVYCT